MWMQNRMKVSERVCVREWFRYLAYDGGFGIESNRSINATVWYATHKQCHWTWQANTHSEWSVHHHFIKHSSFCRYNLWTTRIMANDKSLSLERGKEKKEKIQRKAQQQSNQPKRTEKKAERKNSAFSGIKWFKEIVDYHIVSWDFNHWWQLTALFGNMFEPNSVIGILLQIA